MGEEKQTADAWIEVLRLLQPMTPEERVRCLAATVAAYGLKEQVVDQLSRCSMCGRVSP